MVVIEMDSEVVTKLSSLDCVMLNVVDGSFLVDSSKAGFGGILLNENGSWIMGFSGDLTNSNNTYVEIVAFLKGLQLAGNLNIVHVVRYLDSKLALNLIANFVNPLHSHAAKFFTIQDLLKLDLNNQLSHTRV